MPAQEAGACFTMAWMGGDRRNRPAERGEFALRGGSPAAGRDDQSMWIHQILTVQQLPTRAPVCQHHRHVR